MNDNDYRVLVYIIPDRANLSRKELIKEKFSDNLFEIHDITSKKVNNYIKKELNLDKIHLDETNLILHSLEESRKENKDCPVIIIKDTSITNSSSEYITKITKKIRKIKKIDLCYYSVWSDNCQLYTHSKKYKNISNFVYTYSPHGTQCIYFTPSGRDKILKHSKMRNDDYFNIEMNIDLQLNYEINNNNLKAISIIPNVFEFDIDKNIKTNYDYIKLNRCYIKKKKNKKKIDYRSLGWFIILFIIIIIFAIFLVKFGKKFKK